MKATEANLLEFLEESPRAVIPIYQSTYSWIERECLQLLDNISRPTMKQILQGTIMPIPFPNVSQQEQQRIVEELDGLQTKVAHLKGLQQKTAAELDALLPSKAVRGEP